MKIVKTSFVGEKETRLSVFFFFFFFFVFIFLKPFTGFYSFFLLISLIVIALHFWYSTATMFFRLYDLFFQCKFFPYFLFLILLLPVNHFSLIVVRSHCISLVFKGSLDFKKLNYSTILVRSSLCDVAELVGFLVIFLV